MKRAPFGTAPDGSAVELFTLEHPSGITAAVASYGGTLVSLSVPDRAGRLDDVVLGFGRLEDYVAHTACFGAIVGRYANRIRAGRFTLDGRSYQLSLNQGADHLHGGHRGWDRVVWRAEPFQGGDSEGLRLLHRSPHGDEGYPGTVEAEVRYVLGESRLLVQYEARTDAPTPINLTQHSYFNLAGSAQGDVLDHRLILNADHFTPVDAALLPTGAIAEVAGTPFDFRLPHAIGERIAAPDPQLRLAGGYDHNFIVRREGPGLVHAARLTEPRSGRTLDVLTTEPGVQLYTGNFLDGTLVGKGGVEYGRRAGLCLETQHFPDSPNHPAFPSTILRPGEVFRSETVFAFAT